jgi:thermostable 8-oxoguanine DNA glycosylase
MPTFYFLKGNQVIERFVAAPDAYVLPNVPWGRHDALFTPAYWMTQYWMNEDRFPDRCHRLGQTFEEEVVACLLGGHGIPAEIGVAAFLRLRDLGLIAEPQTCATFSEILKEPLAIEGRHVIYRFWSQKARYVSAALTALREQSPPLDSPKMLRDYLLRIPGIGPKTASWIVRNWLGSSEVAILDIHVVRAGQLMGIYSSADRVQQKYLDMERRFLELARAIGVPAANLDSLIWYYMRKSPRLVADVLSAADHSLRQAATADPRKPSCRSFERSGTQ